MKKLLFLFLFFNVTVTYAQDYISFLDTLLKYQKNIKYTFLNKNDSQKRYVILDTKTFTGKEYIQIFDKLTLQPDYKLGCAYHSESIGGEPLLYVIKKDINLDSLLDAITMERVKNHPFELKKRKKIIKYIRKEKQEKFLKKYSTKLRPYALWEIRNGKYYSEFNYALDSLNHPQHFLEPEHSEMGYFQWLVFNIFGDVFAYFWHSNDHYKYIIYKHEQINDFIPYNEQERWGIELDEKEVRKLLPVDISPKIQLDSAKSKCVIYLYELSPRRELVRNKYSVDCKYPYKIELLESNTIFKIKVNTIF